jgi:transcriptional regulator with XRE-family HTH domain
MPSPPGTPMGPKRQGLSLFGEWFYSLCDVLNVSLADVASLAGINASTLSYNTRDVMPSMRTMHSLWHVFVDLGDKRDIRLSYHVEIAFFNAAGYSSPSQIDVSRGTLETFRGEYGLGPEKEIADLKRQLAEKEEMIKQLTNLLRQNKTS